MTAALPAGPRHVSSSKAVRRRRIRRFGKKLLTSRPVARAFYPFTRGRVPIFMLHRFQHADFGIRGHDPRLLHEALTALRRGGYRLLPLADALDELTNSPQGLYRAAVFTVDDGYRDFDDVAAPIFAEFDCPVTVFLTTGFIDGASWMWWDQVEYLFTSTTRRAFAMRIANQRFEYEWLDEASRNVQMQRLTELLKTVSDAQRVDALARLVATLEVTLPDAPPSQAAPMTWDAVRALGGQGVTFGPHTVTHPILTRTTDDQCLREVRDSWRRVQEQTSSAVPIFCYPNGMPGDYSDREASSIRELGLRGAVTATPGYAHSLREDPRHERFELPRFPFGRSTQDVIGIASGLKRLSMLLKGTSGAHVPRST